MLIYIFVMIIAIVFPVYFAYDYMVDKFGFKKTIIIFAISYAILSCLAVLLREVPTFNSEVVTKIAIEGSRSHIRMIYRDKADDTYFYLKDNWLNPIKICYRVPINHDKMEQYLEIHEKYESDVANLNLFD